MEIISAMPAQASLIRSQPKMDEKKPSSEFSEVFAQKKTEDDEISATGSERLEATSLQKRAETSPEKRIVASPQKESQDPSNEKISADQPVIDKKVDPPIERKISSKESTGSVKAERERAILEFMDSFESEFGIPPEQIVAAMALLNQQQQLQSPEKTIDLVMDQLKLSPEEAPKAREMYSQFLGRLEELDQKEASLKALSPLNLEAIQAPQVQRRFESQQMLQKQRAQGLETLNQNFWKTSSAQKDFGRISKDVSAASLQTETTDEMLPMSQSLMTHPQNLDSQAFESIPQNENPLLERPVMQPHQAHELAQQMAQLQKNRSQESQKTLPTEVGFMVPAHAQAQAQAQVSVASAAENLTPSAASMTAEEGAIGMMPSMTMPKLSGQNSSSDQSFQQDSSSSSAKEDAKTLSANKVKVSDLNYQQISQALAKEKAADPSALPAPVLAQPFDANGAQTSQNSAQIRQIMNQAQYLIKKGGGEMTVKLSPEGLGTLQLNVAVNEGKVNVQMFTETSEAKKLIESSVNDLKSHLSAHKLSVENLKVDVVSGSNSTASAENQNQFNFQGQKDSTRQFWNQFQDSFGNRSQRDNFFDVNTKGYVPKKNQAQLEPIESAKGSRKVEGKGNGLNLVA